MGSLVRPFIPTNKIQGARIIWMRSLGPGYPNRLGRFRRLEHVAVNSLNEIECERLSYLGYGEPTNAARNSGCAPWHRYSTS
jgi:hypothetical protein